MIKLESSLTAQYKQPESLLALVDNNRTSECDAMSCRILLAYLLQKGGTIEDIDVTQAAITFLVLRHPHRYVITVGELRCSVRRVN